LGGEPGGAGVLSMNKKTNTILMMVICLGLYWLWHMVNEATGNPFFFFLLIGIMALVFAAGVLQGMETRQQIRGRALASEAQRPNGRRGFNEGIRTAQEMEHYDG
jgi:hypothetical protein